MPEVSFKTLNYSWCMFVHLRADIVNHVVYVTDYIVYQVVCGVDSCSALNSHVKHLHVVPNHHDVGHRVAICVLGIDKT